MEARIASIRRRTRSRNEATTSGAESDMLTHPPSPVQTSSSPPSPPSPGSPSYYSPSPDPIGPPALDYQPQFATFSTDPDLSTRIRAQFPDITTITRLSDQPTPRTSTVSRSKQRRERRKRLRASRAAPDPPATAVMVPEVKNQLGIISIRRKDFKALTHHEVTFLTDNIRRQGTNIDIQDSTSIYKNTLRIFCDTKIKLQNIWESTKNFPGLSDHPGFCYALPGIKFSDLTRIECRLPPDY